MLQKVIPIALMDNPRAASAALAPESELAPAPEGSAFRDMKGRELRDLRISVTDRCNFRCVYCMPREAFGPNHAFLPHEAILSFEEIEWLARIFVEHGTTKIRLTGGEPLLRKNIEFLVEKLARLRTLDGKPVDLAMTTNGAILARKAQSLKEAGLSRITVSLDALDDAIFKKMNDADFSVADVLEGIDAAHRAGLAPLKVNMVVKKGVNDGEIEKMALFFKNRPIALRFIEYMDAGATNGWRMEDVARSSEILGRLQKSFALSPVAPSAASETATRWRHREPGALGELGFISSVSEAFCGSCVRARISAEGKLYLCLFASEGHDLRSLMRSGATEERMAAVVMKIWGPREDNYSERRSRQILTRSASTGGSVLMETGAAAERRVEMSHIGG